MKLTLSDPSIDLLILIGTSLFAGLFFRSFFVFLVSRIGRIVGDNTQTAVKFLTALRSRSSSLLLSLAALPICQRFVDVLSAKVTSWVEVAAVIGIVLQLGLWLDALITFLIRRKIESSNDPAQLTILGTLTFFARALTWALLLIFTADNLGFQVTTVITGLGIGGIAIALAIQTVLGDLLNSLALVFDKPFNVGDFIRLPEGILGEVKRIGIRSSVIRSLSGEEIIIPNSDLSKSRIQNFKRMNERRVLSVIGVLYSTPAEVMERLPGELREVIQSAPKTRFDRAHFRSFGDSALELEFVYFVLSPNYNEYMDIQQEINLKIMRKFEALEVEFAYPTQTIFLEGLQKQG